MGDIARKNGDKSRKESVTCLGPYNPLPLEFLRSRACAELSPHATKLLLDILAQMGPNGFRNGDISLAPAVMARRGWTSRATLAAACAELREAGLIEQTRQGGRLDCSLWAFTLYAINCDRKKMDVGAGQYKRTDWMKASPDAASIPCETKPAKWKRARKPDENGMAACPVAERFPEEPFRRGTKSVIGSSQNTDFVPPRNEISPIGPGDRSATGHLSEVAIRSSAGVTEGVVGGIVDAVGQVVDSSHQAPFDRTLKRTRSRDRIDYTDAKGLAKAIERLPVLKSDLTTQEINAIQVAIGQRIP